MDGYLRGGYAKPVLQYLARIVLVIIVFLVLDVVGLFGFLISKGQFTLPKFSETLTILLLLEGSIIGGAGAFMFLGYSEYRAAGQGVLNPAIARDQVDRWQERRPSQRKWGIAMLVAGASLILLGLLAGFLSSV